jgi:beta-phosphoglucomutase-like phosphatase (HAD superfamily)
MNFVYQQREEFKGYFDAILTSEDFEYSKPHPDCYEKASKRLGIEVDKCVVFEDSFNGLKSGRAANMCVVGITTTNSREAIEPLADFVIDNYNGFSLELL